MENRIEILGAKYEGFKRGKEDALEFIDEARPVLEGIKNKENPKLQTRLRTFF